MLNFGFWSMLKGMVKVPSLSGLSRVDAVISIESKNLKPVNDGTIDTADSNLNNKIASQVPDADELVGYETDVTYKYYQFAFTPGYSFTPYSFTPYSFVPYTFTPTAPVEWYATGCCGGEQAPGYGTTEASAIEAVLAGCPSATGIVTSTVTWPTVDCSPAYTFTPYSFTPTTNPTLYYAYCADNSEDNVGTSTGLQSTSAYASCAALYNSIHPTGDIMGGWSCSANQASVVVPTCGTTPTYTFTPYSFTPTSYTFTPYSFTPTAYTFTPTAYTFTPTYTFTPYSFTPIPPYSFVPLKVCIDQDTLIQVVGPNDSVEFKSAKDIQIGDEIWSINWDGLLDDFQDPSASTVYPENLEGIKRVKSEIVQIDPSVKDKTIYFNGDKTKRFTAEEKVLIKRGLSHIFVEAKTVTLSDLIFEATDSGMEATPVTSVDYIEEVRNVFKFNAFPVDTIIAGNMVVHNSKV